MGGERVVATVRVHADIHRLVKIKAAERGLTIGELYESGALRVLRDMGVAVPRGGT